MVAQGADELLHRFQPTAHGPGAPFLEIPSRPTRTVVLPEPVEGLLEHPGSDGFQIIREQFAEFDCLFVGEIARTFQKAVARVFEDGLVTVGSEFFGFLSSDLIDGLTEFLGDVETVEHVERGRQHGGNDIEVGLPHVGTDDLDFRATLRAEILEKSGERYGVAFFDDTEQAFAVVVDLIDESHVAVALAVGDLIDAHGGDTLQVPVFESVSDDPFHRAADGVPFGVEGGGGFLPAHASGPCGKEMAVGIATGVLTLRPRDGLDLDAAIRAIHPAHGVGKRDRDVPDRDELELAGGGRAVVSGARHSAARAFGLAVGPGDDPGDDSGLAVLAAQFDGMVNEALEPVDFVE